MAAHLALMGLKVTLYNRTFEHINVIKKRGGIELESAEVGHMGWQAANATSDMARRSRKPRYHGGCTILRTCRYCESRREASQGWTDTHSSPWSYLRGFGICQVLRDEGCTADVTISEAETFIYASRSDVRHRHAFFASRKPSAGSAPG